MKSSFAVATIAGILFGAGLALGGMTDPVRVRGFLDIFGNWDPTLAFVMGSALAVMAIGWAVQSRLKRPLVSGDFCLPDRSDLTARLVGGSALFGVGWGIAGLCPGPAIAILPFAPFDALIFCVTMAIGMAINHFLFEQAPKDLAHATE